MEHPVPRVLSGVREEAERVRDEVSGPTRGGLIRLGSTQRQVIHLHREVGILSGGCHCHLEVLEPK